MSEIEKELETAVAKAVSEMNLPERPPLRTVAMPQPVSLTDQWTKLQNIETELRTRIRRERMAINAEYERMVVETNTDFDRRVDDALSKLDRDRHAALHTLSQQTETRLREIETLIKRMGS